jgi:hypothetical protein
LLANLPMPFLAGAMHDDMVKTLPETAAWLGHSDLYPHQAFRVGPSAWGVQFHPEVSLAGYREWVAQRGATDPVALRRMRRGAADFQRLDENVVAGISVLARRFADLVRAFSRAPPGPAATLCPRHGRLWAVTCPGHRWLARPSFSRPSGLSRRCSRARVQGSARKVF